MRKLAVLAAFIVALLVPAAAQAAIPQVFTNTTSPVNCAVQPSGATAGQRWCGTGTATVLSWDGVPIDVAVTFPAASGSDDNYPVIGIYHGWGGSKIPSSNAATQHFVNLGYAVFSITDRGWGASCGGAPTGQFPLGNHTQKAAPCAKGYIHLMHNAFEVRDVQYLLGKLADQGGATGLIDPQRIGATGGSYGGGMALQLGALKDRVQLPDGSLIQWLSPSGKGLGPARGTPQLRWSGHAPALLPNPTGVD
jgi:predicted dienelactone hydrolase